MVQPLNVDLNPQTPKPSNQFWFEPVVVGLFRCWFSDLFSKWSSLILYEKLFLNGMIHDEMSIIRAGTAHVFERCVDSDLVTFQKVRTCSSDLC